MSKCALHANVKHESRMKERILPEHNYLKISLKVRKYIVNAFAGSALLNI